MTLFIGIAWLVTVGAAFAAGCMMAKRVDKTVDGVKQSAGEAAKKAAGDVTEAVQDAAKKVS